MLVSPVLCRSHALRKPVRQGLTRSHSWRVEQLRRLDALLKEHESEILEALTSDLGKPPVEAYFEMVAVRGQVLFCGQSDPCKLRIAPTLLAFSRVGAASTTS